MNYRDFNDYELLSYINEDNEDANEIIFNKYRPLIESIAKKMINLCRNTGLEVNDLIQEGMLGLNAAINSFSEESNALFYTYAKTCIERKIISVVVASRRNKHKILNESLPYEIYNDQDEIINFDKLLADNSYNPENIVLDGEEENELFDKINNLLTPLEQEVFELKIGGFTYKEIALILDKSEKTIDNALHRIKTKIKNQMIMN